jgi:hypothetical protein
LYTLGDNTLPDKAKPDDEHNLNVNSKGVLGFTAASRDANCEGYVAYRLSYQSVDYDHFYYISWSIPEHQKLPRRGINYCGFIEGDAVYESGADAFKLMQSDATGLQIGDPNQLHAPVESTLPKPAPTSTVTSDAGVVILAADGSGDKWTRRTNPRQCYALLSWALTDSGLKQGWPS